MALRTRTSRTLSVIVGIVAGWLLAAFLTALVMNPPGAPLLAVPILVFGILAGLLSALFELWVVPRYMRRMAAWPLLLVRTLFYTMMTGGGVILFGGLIGAMQEDTTLQAVYQDDAFHTFLTDGSFVAIVLLLTVASFLINFVRQISRMIGPGHLWRLFLGRYQQPVEEERLFMFLDITSSTAIAEDLGPLGFNAFKNDFFYDIADPILSTRGEIYQYVGDEVVIIWKVRNGKPIGDALRCFFLIAQKIEARHQRYLRRYGIVPEFKAGVHGGTVIISEIGDIKRDIVYSGDPVNTASRIEAQCHELGRRLLISKQVMSWYTLSEGAGIESLGPILLPGKSEEVHLYSIEAFIAPRPVRGEGLGTSTSQ